MFTYRWCLLKHKGSVADFWNASPYMCITEWIRLEGTMAGHLFQPSWSNKVILEYKAQNCAQTILEFSQLRRPDSLSAQSVPVLSQVLLYTQMEWCASFCAHCLLSYCSAPPHRAWIHPLDTLPSGSY